MKRLTVILLVLLMLCGCTPNSGTPTSNYTAGATAPTVELYDPNSYIEEETKGAVRAYPLTDYHADSFCFMGQNIILFSQDEHINLTTLHLLQGETLGVVRSLTLDCTVYPTDPHLRVSGNTLGYYNMEENAIVLINADLTEARRIRLPDDVRDIPVLSPDLQTLYYCLGNEIRALDLNDGISRLLKQHSCQTQSIVDVHFGGTVLEVYAIDENGNDRVVFISAETGETLGSDENLLNIRTNGNTYILQRQDGTVQELLVGKLEQEMQALHPIAEEFVFEALSINSIVAGKGHELSLYDVSSGRITAAVSLGEGVAVRSAAPAPGGNYVWVHGFDSQADCHTLYRWDLSATEKNGTTSYLAPRYTAETPNTAVIADCQKTADEIGAKYGVVIHVDSQLPTAANYRFVNEHQPEALEAALTQLDHLLAQFPEGFFSKMAAVNKSGGIHISLVRALYDIADGPVPDNYGLHYTVSGNHHIALQIGADFESAVYHEICHTLDAFVYSGSKAFDLWDQLNPEGFVYLSSYKDFEINGDDPLLLGETQAFVDGYAMTFAKEDRARLFEKAMTDGNEGLFAAPIMQAKLRQLCLGIREACDWEKEEIELPWEQYLIEETEE